MDKAAGQSVYSRLHLIGTQKIQNICSNYLNVPNIKVVYMAIVPVKKSVAINRVPIKRSRLYIKFFLQEARFQFDMYDTVHTHSFKNPYSTQLETQRL